MLRTLLSSVGATALLIVAEASSPVPTYEIKLDLPVKERYAQVLEDFRPALDQMWDTFFPDNTEGKLLLDFIEALAIARGPEPETLQLEIEILAGMYGKPMLPIKGLQMLYELQTLMIPIENITLPWRGPGCTGIIARDTVNENVYHARNLDFAPKHIFQNLAYVGIFTRGGVEQYRYQTIAGYQLATTGMKRGPNGFTIERNTKFPEHEGGNEEMLKALFVDKVPLNGWSIRNVFETCNTYECAVETISTVPFASTEYSIISGATKGTVIARTTSSVSHTLELGKLDVDIDDPNYIIMTNFDFYFHDIREYFDATGGRIDRPRRIVAQKQLSKLSVYEPDALYGVINLEGVIAGDTIFQAIMSVKADLFNTSLPVLSASQEADAHVHTSSKKYIDRFKRLYTSVTGLTL